jgi:hypothetical protein
VTGRRGRVEVGAKGIKGNVEQAKEETENDEQRKKMRN